MPSSRRLVLSLSLAGLAALGAYAWYANRPPAVLPGGMQPAGAQGGPAAAGTAGAKAVAGGAGAAPGAPVVVETHTVDVRAVADDVSAVGSLVSNESVVLRPEVSGRIEAIRFRDGEAVRHGEVLIEFDAAVQRAELQQARASLTLAESNFRRSQDLFSSAS